MEKNQKKKKKKTKLFLTILIIITILISFFLYMKYIGTTGLKTKEYKITSIKIPKSFHGTTIIQFSDIHYGRTIKKERLAEIVNKINSYDPDLIVFTGDFFDKNITVTSKMEEDAKILLSKLDSKLGKYAIFGNHDYYYDNYQSLMKDSGFILLENTYDLIYNESNEPIFLGGVLSSTKKEADIKKTLTLEEGLELPKYQIILMHEPDYITEVLKEIKPNLILAGHSHNGQIRLPIVGATITPPGAKKYYKEEYKLGNTKVYISSGLGTSVINLRLFNRPSINLYRLTTN